MYWHASSNVFKKFTEKLYHHSRHNIVGIINSYIDEDIIKLAIKQGTATWCWEQKFINERDHILQSISQNSLDFGYISSLDMAIAHRLFLRTIYSNTSQYLFIPTLRYYISKSIQFFQR